MIQTHTSSSNNNNGNNRNNGNSNTIGANLPQPQQVDPHNLENFIGTQTQMMQMTMQQMQNMINN